MATAAGTSATCAAIAASPAVTAGAGDAKAAVRSVSLPALPPPPGFAATLGQPRSASYCRRVARNVIRKAVGDPSAEITTTETPEIVKTLQDAWDRVEDKYAVTSLAVAAAIALWSTAGMISAIDRLPLVPGVMELVGIGYTGWFAYRNLVFLPDREAFAAKIKGLYNDIIGSS